MWWLPATTSPACHTNIPNITSRSEGLRWATGVSGLCGFCWLCIAWAYHITANQRTRPDWAFWPTPPAGSGSHGPAPDCSGCPSLQRRGKVPRDPRRSTKNQRGFTSPVLSCSLKWSKHTDVSTYAGGLLGRKIWFRCHEMTP